MPAVLSVLPEPGQVWSVLPRSLTATAPQFIRGGEGGGGVGQSIAGTLSDYASHVCRHFLSSLSA